MYIGAAFSKLGKFKEAIDVWEDIDNMIKMWNEIEISETYELVIDESIKVMVNFFLELNNQKEMSKEIYELFACREIILQCLLIKNTQVSHYTSINVAKQIFKKENKNKNLRLSLLTVSNDPTEGEILLNYLNVSEKFQKRPKYPFGTCVTFELDSLNQLRLYGKENNEEATGIALVLSSIFLAKIDLFLKVYRV